MKPNYTIVDKGEAKVATDTDPITALAALNIAEDRDIVVACFNPAYRKVGLARNIAIGDLSAFIESIIGNIEIDPKPLVQVRLVGRALTEESRKQVKQILEQLDVIDAGRDVLNIVSADIGQKEHPESFKITAFDGSIGEIQALRSN